MVVYVENPMEATNKVTKLKFSKAAGYNWKLNLIFSRLLKQYQKCDMLKDKSDGTCIKLLSWKKKKTKQQQKYIAESFK